jgi:non-canonical purine NTP pyrophosphatase (RdgB/HAM1 family)
VTLSSLVFVTSNPGKAREASRFLGRPVEARALDLPEMQSLDFEEVAAAKARGAAEALGTAVLVEDSGLALAAWNGFPGPLTKWLTESVGEAGLARMLEPFGDRRVEAVSVLAVARPGDSRVTVAVGRVPGVIAEAPRGRGGFGWDVIFVPEGESRTFAEMSAEEKDARSHRAKAFARLRELLG